MACQGKRVFFVLIAPFWKRVIIGLSCVITLDLAGEGGADDKVDISWVTEDWLAAQRVAAASPGDCCLRGVGVEMHSDVQDAVELLG